MKKLCAPNGKRIIGTSEILKGIAFIMNEGNTVTETEPGTFTFEYEGSTDVDWNSQETATDDGERIFVDEDRSIWLERDLVIMEVA